MATERDITIIGGGIAGLSLGIALLSRGLQVRLHEAFRYPRHRVCGEFISGVDGKTLERLGVDDLVADAKPLVSTGWYDSRGEILAASLPRAALGISRFRLDHRMAERFRERGGRLEQGNRLRLRDLEGPGTVLCTGRPPRKESDWIGLKSHFQDLELSKDLEMHLGENGYLGMSGIEDGRVNVCGLFKKRNDISARKGETLVRYIRAVGLGGLADRLEAADPDPSSSLGVSAFSFGYQLERDCPHLRLGDRGAIIPPFTGNGMSMAFESAEMAIAPLVEYARGDRSWSEARDQCERRLRRRFRRRLAVSRLFHPVMDHQASRSLVRGASSAGLLPFGWLYRSTR